MPAYSYWKKLPFWANAIGAVFIAGCSSLSPQIFSDSLIVGTASFGTYDKSISEPIKTLEEAYAEAAYVQRRYITAVRDQGNAMPQLAAGLIGLGALGLYKGITGVDSDALLAAGVLGSTAWVFDNTFLSKPRLDVYRAGAEALMCAMTAIEPLRKTAKALGTSNESAGSDTLYGRRADVTKKIAALESLLRKHASLNEIKEIPGAIKPAGKTKKLPPPAVINIFNEASEQITAAKQQVTSTEKVIEAINDAGGVLWKKSFDIQVAVSKEVDKTVPNLASVLSAAAGMRDVGFTLTGYSGIKAFGAQSKIDQAAIRTLTPDEKIVLQEIENVTEKLRDARVALSDMTGSSLGIGRAELRTAMNECAVKVSGVTLTVTPSGDSIPVATDSSISFYLSGGSGTPSAEVIAGPKHAKIQLKVDDGRVRYEFTPPPGSLVGDIFVLRFTDSERKGNKVVEIVVTEATKGTSKKSSENASQPQSAAIAKGFTGTDKSKTTATSTSVAGPTKFGDMPPDDRKLLGLSDNAADSDIQAAINRCQASARPEFEKKSGQFDSATRLALKSKPPLCNPSP